MSDQTPPDHTPAGAVLPPTPPQPTIAPLDPSKAVAGPAIALVITAGLDLLGGLFFTFVSFLSLTVGSGFNRYNNFDDAEVFEQLLSGAFGFVLFLGGAALSALIVYGAIKMMQLQSWGLSMTAAILAVIPCISSPCCVVGIPFGIWALVVLHRPEVRQAFT
jgi:ABC-type proline/glycine betaine transport system permease subunit